jgi:hypothetical protein
MKIHVNLKKKNDEPGDLNFEFGQSRVQLDHLIK